MHNHNLLNWFVALLGVFFSGMVFTFLIRKKINEKNTLVWLGCAIIILVLAVNPKLLDRMAAFIGIDYPPALLFLLSVLVLLMLNLYQSIQISVLHDKMKELTQYIALRDAQKGQQDNKSSGRDVR